MYNLFEYQNKENFQGSCQELEAFLDMIWQNRERNNCFYESNHDQIEAQRFIQFIHKSKEIKSNKYVGVIHFNGHNINLLPKIFYEKNRVYSQFDITQINYHILWWLSYCRKIKFPSYRTLLGNNKCDFFEVLIYLFSKFTKDLLNSYIYQQFEDVSNETVFLKGRLDTNRYINENITRGNWHKINCTYDAFVFDNKFNRIIKYVASLLFRVTSSQENKKNLRDILFILDDVADERFTIESCSRIKFNPLFSEFNTVLDYCKLFLSNSVSFDYKNELELFAFLLPMEYVFEDFVFGFIDKELAGVSTMAQRRDVFLDKGRIFNLRPDLFIKSDTKSLLADTKYKIVYSNIDDKKRGISQSDLYQMVAYAIRYNVDDVLLFYPANIKENSIEETEVKIIDNFADEKEISITAYQLPIINRDLFDSRSKKKSSLIDLFSDTKKHLQKRLEDILIYHYEHTPGY